MDDLDLQRILTLHKMVLRRGIIIDYELQKAWDSLPSMVAELSDLRVSCRRLQAERNNFVKINRLLRDRPDIGDRARNVDALIEENKALLAEIIDLRDEVTSWRDSAKKASGEGCGDEKHCTCVGPLREQIARLQNNQTKPS